VSSFHSFTKPISDNTSVSSIVAALWLQSQTISIQAAAMKLSGTSYIVRQHLLTMNHLRTGQYHS
jgi:hypothetical protein